MAVFHMNCPIQPTMPGEPNITSSMCPAEIYNRGVQAIWMSQTAFLSLHFHDHGNH